MNITMPPEMAEFIIQHFKKRVERRKIMMPNPDYIDPWLRLADPKDEEESRKEAIEAKGKALNFIHNANLVIDLLEAVK